MQRTQSFAGVQKYLQLTLFALGSAEGKPSAGVQKCRSAEGTGSGGPGTKPFAGVRGVPENYFLCLSAAAGGQSTQKGSGYLLISNCDMMILQLPHEILRFAQDDSLFRMQDDKK